MSAKQLLSRDNFLQPVAHPLQPRHVLTHLGTLYRSSRFVSRHLSLSSLSHFYLRLPAWISGPYSSHEAPPL